jgi:hypothetical protein
MEDGIWSNEPTMHESVIHINRLYLQIGLYTADYPLNSNMLENGRTKLALLVVTAAVLGLTAVAPAFAWECNSITFSPTSTSSSPITVTQITTVYTTGNKITYSDFSSDYMYVYITGVTSGWTVTVTSPSPYTSVSNGIIVGPFTGSGSFAYTITVIAPSTPSTKGQFTINAVPTSSSSSTSGLYWSDFPCASVTVYLETAASFPPPISTPEFPLGMVLLLAVTMTGLLLVRSKFASKYSPSPV